MIMTMYKQRHPTGLRENSRGFSLVELMVAMVVTLILLAGIGQIFLSSKKSFNIQDSLSRIQENGRYAIDTLAQDIRRAGYWGGNADITKISGTSIEDDGVDIIDTTGSCSAADTDWALKLNRHIFGKNDAKDDGNGDYACLDPFPYAGGDILVVRYASPWVVGGTSLPLDSSCGSTIAGCYPNTYFLRSSLFKGRLFQGVKAADTKNTLVTPPTRTAELMSRIYFVGAAGDASKCPGSGTVKSLNRLILDSAGAAASEEVAYGVEDLQLRYGVDTDGNNSVDQYYDADDVPDGAGGIPDWDKVRAVRVWLLLRAECPDTGYTNDTPYPLPGGNVTYNDAYRRQLYTTTVQLRNH
jgi:type IV pilus assembly protein PilW